MKDRTHPLTVNYISADPLLETLFADGLVWNHETGFLNSKNVGLMHDLNEFVQSLRDCTTSLDDFIAKFGVPDRHYLNSVIQLRSFLLRFRRPLTSPIT